EEAPAVCRIQANPDVRVADARIFVHHGDVAKQGQCGAQTDGIAVDAADDGNFAIQHGVDDALGFPGHDLELFRFTDGRAHPFDVAARAEGFACASQHDGVQVAAFAQVNEDARERRVQLGIHGIQGLRAVDGQIGHTVLDFQDEGFVFVFHDLFQYSVQESVQAASSVSRT